MNTESDSLMECMRYAIATTTDRRKSPGSNSIQIDVNHWDAGVITDTLARCEQTASVKTAIEVVRVLTQPRFESDKFGTIYMRGEDGTVISVWISNNPLPCQVMIIDMGEYEWHKKHSFAKI